MPLPFDRLPIPDPGSLLEAIPLVEKALSGGEPWAEKPWAPGKPWTFRQMAWHLVDMETVFLHRVRLILTEEDPLFPNVEQELWVTGLPGGRDLRLASVLFAASRRVLADLVEKCGSSGLARKGRHGAYGPMTLGEVLRHAHGHSVHHARQLEEARGPFPRP